MLITEVLRDKGRSVVTVPPACTVAELLAVLAEHRIGAVVVSADGRTVEGIISERDVVRALAARGAAVLGEEVTALATRDVHTTTRTARIEDLMRVMTERRIRHVPLVHEGVLEGIVSIGDVVKHRMTELETEAEALTAYVSGG